MQSQRRRNGTPDFRMLLTELLTELRQIFGHMSAGRKKVREQPNRCCSEFTAALQPVRDIRLSEFEISMLNDWLRDPFPQPRGDFGEFGIGGGTATAVGDEENCCGHAVTVDLPLRSSKPAGGKFFGIQKIGTGDSAVTEPTTPLPPAPVPERVGPYVIDRELGAGGMGTVYLARHAESGETVAVKVLPASMGREPGFVARFNREIAAMKQLSSPQIVALYDSGEDQGLYYYAMEYVPGETLTDRLRRDKRIPWREVLEISSQVCKALKAAHNSGIVHRDLKPSNLLLREDGAVKLTDFGIAQVFASGKLTVTGGILGTAEYMSPEQAAGKRASKQSDIYSLGAVMYVMLTGRPPFVGKTTLDIVQKHRFSQFDSPKRIVTDIPYWLDEVVCKCLSKKPEDRYPDAYVLGLRLQEIARKVDYRDGGDSPAESISATSVTQAEAAAGGGLADADVGGTLARDLFRQQLETQTQASPLARWFDNGWVLAGLLILLLGGVAGLIRWNRVTPEQQFAAGEALMEKPEGSAWDLAKSDYFLPLLAADAETWGPRVDPYLAQIQTYELKKGLLGRDFRRTTVAGSEPEVMLRQILELQKSGRPAEAQEKLEALEALLEENPAYASLLPVVRQLREQLITQKSADRLDYVQQALDRAQQLADAGKDPAARRIWQGVIDLYDADPDARPLVKVARERLAQSKSVENLSVESPAR